MSLSDLVCVFVPRQSQSGLQYGEYNNKVCAMFLSMDPAFMKERKKGGKRRERRGKKGEKEGEKRRERRK